MRAAIKTVGLLGGGVIGAGWAARCALNGYDAVVCDLDPEAERKVEEVMTNARRAWSRLTLAPLPSAGSIRVVKTIEAAAEGADFIQESLPEQEALKISLLTKADKVAPPDVIIGSSTSGLLPSRLQASLAHPERFVVGHPFNPVYLMPLVEVCGGARTSEATKQSAAAFYRSLGMHPLLLRKEIDGFVADRMMEALWREALWLIHDDVATAAAGALLLARDDAAPVDTALSADELAAFQRMRRYPGELSGLDPDDIAGSIVADEIAGHF